MENPIELKSTDVDNPEPLLDQIGMAHGVEESDFYAQNEALNDDDQAEIPDQTCQIEIDHVDHYGFSSENTAVQESTEQVSHFPCGECKLVFSDMESRKKHYEKHEEEKPFACLTCGKRFTQQSNLASHERRHIGENPFKCQYCDKIFAKASNLKTHEARHTGQGGFKCQVCNKGYTFRFELQKHMRRHPGTTHYRPYKCPYCDKTFARTASQKAHIVLHTGERPHTCKICKKSFRLPSELYSHKATHPVTQKSFECVECSKIFHSSSVLRLHLRSVHGDSKSKAPVVCTICFKTFKQRSALWQHKKSHMAVYSFQCKEEACGRKFKTKHQLKAHMAVHNADKSFKCDVCGKMFSRKTNLQAHMNIHIVTKERPFTCKVCGKGCFYQSELRVHERTHTGEKPFVCQVCGQKFSQRGNLSQHEITHSDTKSNKCKIEGCTRAYKYQTDLLKHQKLKHSLPSSDADKDTSATTVEESALSDEDSDKFKCNLCTKEFVTAARYKNHQCVPKVKPLKPFACNKCDQKFEKSFQLQKHKRHHVESFKCEKCEVDFVTELLLQAHEEAHKKELMCKICKEIFTQENSYKKHLKTHVVRQKESNNVSKEDGTHDCSVCAEIFTNAPNLKMHEARVHGLSPFRCKLCVEGFQRASQLKEHEETHLKKSNHQCHSCQQRFLTKTDLSQHLQDHVKDRNYRCERCGEFFKFRQQFADHECQIKGTLSFTCSLCGDVFATVVELEDHMSAHASNETFECSQCMLEFLELPALREHETKHVDLDPYPCDFCELRFPTGEDCESHSEIHRMLKCQFCDDFFRTNEELEGHESEHNLLRCAKCSDVFKFKSDLKTHQKTCGEKFDDDDADKFACDVCHKSFSQLGNMQRHRRNIHKDDRKDKEVKRKHSTKNGFECNICGKTFTQLGNMERHQRNIHRVEPNGDEKRGKEAADVSKVKSEGDNDVESDNKDGFVCNICKKSFTQLGNMERHQRSVHKVVPKRDKTRGKGAADCSNANKNDDLIDTKRGKRTSNHDSKSGVSKKIKLVFNAKRNSNKNSKPTMRNQRGKVDEVANHSSSPGKTKKPAESQTSVKPVDHKKKVERAGAKKAPFKCRHCESRFTSASKKMQHEQTH